MGRPHCDRGGLPGQVAIPRGCLCRVVPHNASRKWLPVECRVIDPFIDAWLDRLAYLTPQQLGHRFKGIHPTRKYVQRGSDRTDWGQRRALFASPRQAPEHRPGKQRPGKGDNGSGNPIVGDSGNRRCLAREAADQLAECAARDDQPSRNKTSRNKTSPNAV